MTQFNSPDDPSPNVGTSYGAIGLETGDPEIVIPIDVESSSWVIKAPPANNDLVYIGWDDNLTTSNGFPLDAAEALSVDMNNQQQPLYGVAAQGGDELRYLTVE